MKNKLIVKAFALMLCVMLALCACAAPANEPADDPEAQATEQPVAETEAPEDEELVTPAPTDEPEEEPIDETEYPTREAALPFTYERETKNEAADDAFAPRITTLDNGVQIQRTPINNVPYDFKVVESWNNIYLNADNRGCTACHTIEDALEGMTTYHGIIYMGYETEQTLANCFGCHSFYTTKLKDSIHTTHFREPKFEAMGGSCDSCHYIEDGEFLRWDYVKYDVMQGFIDMPADTVKASFEWGQDEMTPVDKMYYKSIKSAPEDWLTDDSQIIPEIYDQWTIKVTGDVDNPYEMTLDEMVQTFGTETHVMKSHCTVNGPGEAMIYQAEVTGIPLAKIIEYAQPHEDANMLYPIGDDNYCYNIYTQTALDLNGLIITEMYGEPMPADQGYPCAFWCYQMSAGNFVKRIVELQVVHSDEASWDFYGDFTDATTGEPFDKPNIGVLNATNGQIFDAGETLHLEGYADAWNEPITKIEMSYDHGATWIEYPIENADVNRWVYWKLDIDTSEMGTGPFLIKLRATSLKADGTERINNTLTNFYFNLY